MVLVCQGCHTNWTKTKDNLIYAEIFQVLRYTLNIKGTLAKSSCA